MIPRVVRMYEQVATGPLYAKTAKLMATYRSVAARMQNAKQGTRGKLDRQLERLGEQISESLAELTEGERQALTCWKDGILPDTYEVDYDAIIEKPYVKIRREDRWLEEYNIDDVKKSVETDPKREAEDKAKLEKFLRMGLEDF